MSDPDVSTLQDVADRAGVSRATASLGLRGKGRMADETRERIRQAASELDYVANMTARNLRTDRSGSIGLYVPDQSQSFRYYMDVAFGAVERAQESDLLVTLVPTASDVRSPMIEQLDGFVVVDPDDHDPLAARLLAGRRPVVSGEFPAASLTEPWAVAYGDHRRGMRMLLDHVWEQGARRPACMLPSLTTSWGREMDAAYSEWCTEKNVPQMRTLSWFDVPEADVRRSVGDILRAGDRPDAMVTAPEGMATLVLDVARAAGLEVGVDLLLASYVDSDTLRFSSPSVTALDLAPREMGRAAVDLLVGALDETLPRGSRREVPITLVVRESTRRAI